MLLYQTDMFRCLSLRHLQFSYFFKSNKHSDAESFILASMYTWHTGTHHTSMYSRPKYKHLSHHDIKGFYPGVENIRIKGL